MSGEYTAFFYGTLMAPEIFFSVCFGDPSPPKVIRELYTFTAAILDGYCRHCVQLADYPGIIPEQGRSVRGVYATGLTDANMEKLDHFEGSEYERVQVQVRLLGRKGDDAGGEEKKASVYVFRHPDDLERAEWDFEAFRRDKMESWTRQRWDYIDGTVDDDVRNGAV
ncbi:hypothetical protein CDD83_8022 [Cordyceps sp. RAO-2017]|nr:hypothetical protein CDD83_8022 [Cordyceps sp. RAO-2017]